MTTGEPDIDIHAHDDRDTDAKLALQQRQQLSALVDGELAPDQARFLARRLGHDGELAGRWERWHLVGDVLRGQAVVAMPGGAGGFAARVAAVVAAERKAPAPRPRWQHGLGVALAASVAAVALFVARPLSVDGDLPPADSRGEPVLAAAPASVPPPTAEPLREVSVPQFAVVAAPDVPAPGTDTARVASQAAAAQRIASAPDQLAATQAGALPADAVTATASDAPDAALPATVLAAASDVLPFASPREPQARPWPRAVLPGLAGGAGDLTVGLEDTAPAPSFYPFEPRLPVDPERTP